MRPRMVPTESRLGLGIWLALAAVGLLSIVQVSGQAGPPPSGKPGIDTAGATAAIDALMTTEMRARRIPGVAVAVVEDGRIVLQRAYGVGNLETDTPLTTDSVFELASVTKQFTAAAVMLLVEDGKVRLDDRLSAYLETTPPAWERITVRHLLTHTSGLSSAGIPRVDGTAPLNVTRARALEFIAEQPLQWPTGETGWYSDAAYFLLGLVIEKASGQAYREFMRQRIFEPAGMPNTSILDRARVLKGRVSTYSLRDGQWFNWRRDWDYEVPSFFGIFSTLGDLAAWDAALRRGAALQPASLEAMWTPATLANGQRARVSDQWYGFGWELSNQRGARTVAHSGASGTYFLRFLDDPLTVVVLTNLDGESGRHHRSLAAAVAGIVRPQYVPPHRLTPREDPDPAIARAAQGLLADFAAQRESETMSSGYRAWYASAAGQRAWLRSRLGPAAPPHYLATDRLDGQRLWNSEPLERLVHYATDVKGTATYVSFGVTKDGKIASVDFYLP